ncbi:MAG: phage tail sheath C-terminal domain-containing protein [Bacteroidota bacterium]
MLSYKTPGVYVEEVASFPPSVAPVSTAIPAFIGYTQKADESLIYEPIRISSFLEYKDIFGGPSNGNYQFNVTEDMVVMDAVASEMPDKLLYHHLDFFFKNGGGSCYVVSTGNYYSDAKLDDFTTALDALAKEDEPTLYVFPDALELGANYYQLVIASLQSCHRLGDRFTIIDVPKDASEADFRNSAAAPAQQLRYGAAYKPYVETTLSYAWKDESVTVNMMETVQSDIGRLHTDGSGEGNGLLITYNGDSADKPTVSIVKDPAVAGTAVNVEGSALTITLKGDSISTGTVLGKWDDLTEKGNFDMVKEGTGSMDVTPGINAAEMIFHEVVNRQESLADIKESHTAIYANIESQLNDMRITLPPSAGLAGIYASVDRDRGVWKAPANVPMAAVIQPTEKITNEQQESMNVDPTSGKSINAIRAFTGKGTVVWGARTLEGNSNDWRYVSVRRLFNMVEESLKKATDFAVFEPNDANTWLKVKGMSESFLFGLYEQGAFAGSEPSNAYYVNVGLGTTMTQQDVLEGRMIVEIGIAPVRPAEFIILRFTQKIQE